MVSVAADRIISNISNITLMGRKITTKIEADVLTELKKLVAPKQTYSSTIKMLIDHYNNTPAKGPAANKYG